MHLNLLPKELVRRSLIRRLLRCWTWAALCMTVGVAIILGAMYSQLNADVARVRAERDAANHLHHLKDENERLTGQAEAVSAQIRDLQAREKDQRLLAVLGTVSQSARQAAGRLQLQRLSVQLNPAAETEANKAPPRGAPGLPIAGKNSPAPTPAPVAANRLAIDGVASNTTTVSSFIAAMRDTGLFTRVELKASTESGEGSRVSRHFQLECQF